jgi:hypothetical protein
VSGEPESILNVPSLRILSLEGKHWPDGWITKELHVTCEALENISGLDVEIWNPDSSIRYARNIVTILFNNKEWNSDELVMGERAIIHAPVEYFQGDEFDFSIVSSVNMQPDVIDSRERGVVLISISTVASA